MNAPDETTFQVFIDGKQAGRPAHWRHTPLTVNSRWDIGGDQEKFEVLSAIRRSYNPDNRSDIRGSERQLPSQIGRSEGFTELSYCRTAAGSPRVVIVPGLMLYHRAPH